MAKFCSGCGARLEDAVKFCTYCGFSQSAPPPQRPVQPVPLLVPQQPVQPAPLPPIPPAPQVQPLVSPVAFQPQFSIPQQQQPTPPPMRQPELPPIPQGVPLTEKQLALRDAPLALNLPGQLWEVTVEGDAIVARWKWKDSQTILPYKVTDDVRNYKFTVTLGDNQTWREVDDTGDKLSKAQASGGKLSLGTSSNSFSGKTNQKSFQLGKNESGQAGMVREFDTTPVKESVRAYLKSRGWKKAGLFG